MSQPNAGNTGPGIGTGITILIFVAAIAAVFFYVLSQPPPVDITGTASGPCAALSLGSTPDEARVYVDGELLATGDVGRWAPTANGARCSASVNVSDVDTAANFYELRIGPMRARISAGSRQFRMET
jgi:hypothetical protein